MHSAINASTRQVFGKRTAVDAVATLGAGCRMPVGAHATIEGEVLVLRAMIGTTETAQIARTEDRGPVADAHLIGARLATSMLSNMDPIDG